MLFNPYVDGDAEGKRGREGGGREKWREGKMGEYFIHLSVHLKVLEDRKYLSWCAECRLAVHLQSPTKLHASGRLQAMQSM